MNPVLINGRNTTEEPVYTNFDHTFNGRSVDQITSDPKMWGSHTAFQYCGWIRWDNMTRDFVEEVYVGGRLAGTHYGRNLSQLIALVISIYGRN